MPLTFTNRYFSPMIFQRFTLTYLGLFFTHSFSNKHNNFFYQKKYIFKKTFFSFLRLNEAKLNLLFTHKKFYIFKFTRSHNNLFSRLNTSEYHLYNHISFNFFSTGFALASLFNTLTTVQSLTRNPSVNYLYPPQAQQMSDIRIVRIKFKPGYQRL
jgi:hypothetical protein